MSNKVAIESLSMDLLRVATNLHKGSYQVALRFSDEARMRCKEINFHDIKPYFAKILNDINTCLSNKSTERTAEDALMYSILCKNYARKYYN